MKNGIYNLFFPLKNTITQDIILVVFFVYENVVDQYKLTDIIFYKGKFNSSFQFIIVTYIVK